MNTSGEVADLMVKEGIQITESAVKLVGVGEKMEDLKMFDSKEFINALFV